MDVTPWEIWFKIYGTTFEDLEGSSSPFQVLIKQYNDGCLRWLKLVLGKLLGTRQENGLAPNLEMPLVECST